MDFNMIAIIGAALIPTVIGFLWYNPRLFGTAWMKETGLTEEQLKNGNMAVIFGVSIVLSFLLAFFLPTLTTHQVGATQLIGGDPAAEGVLPSFQAFITDYKDAFRSFKHGALHGALAGIFLILPVMATNGLYERKSWKHIFINVGYWTVTLALMGGVVCEWA